MYLCPSQRRERFWWRLRLQGSIQLTGKSKEDYWSTFSLSNFHTSQVQTTHFSIVTLPQISGENISFFSKGIRQTSPFLGERVVTSLSTGYSVNDPVQKFCQLRRCQNFLDIQPNTQIQNFQLSSYWICSQARIFQARWWAWDQELKISFPVTK